MGTLLPPMAYLSYRFRLRPNATQERALSSQIETLRQVYNAVLAYHRDLYESEQRLPKWNELYKVFAALRNAQIADAKAGGAGPHWLAQVSAVAMRDACVRLSQAIARFLAIRRGEISSPKGKSRSDGCLAGYPRYKSFSRYSSMEFKSYASGCVLHDRRGRPVRGDVAESKRGFHLSLFGVGSVRIVMHRAITGTIKTASVKRDVDGKWYVVLVAQTVGIKVTPSTLPAVGIDVGLEHFLTTSGGEQVANPRILKTELKTLRRLQRSSARKQEAAKKRKQKFRECRNLQKSFRRTAKLHVRVRNLRREFHRKVSRSLVNRFGAICAEKLNVRGMLRSSNLARSIMDVAWGNFLILLQRKAESAGVRFVKVDARGTSQTCPKCGGEVRKALRERTHDCQHCGYKTDRDHASAQVILARGLVGSGVGQTPIGVNPNDDPGGNALGSLGCQCSIESK